MTVMRKVVWASLESGAELVWKNPCAGPFLLRKRSDILRLRLECDHRVDIAPQSPAPTEWPCEECGEERG